MSQEIAVSFAGLVKSKSNNGLFKSEKQAAFLLAKCQEGTFVCGGTIYNNTFSMFYHCDSKGVVSVEKHTDKSNKTVTTWTRVTDQEFKAEKAEKEACRVRDTAAQEAMLAVYKLREEALNSALVLAQEFVKSQMMKAGVGEEAANNASTSVLKDLDGIISCMTTLVNCPKFVVAWERYLSC